MVVEVEEEKESTGCKVEEVRVQTIEKATTLNKACLTL